MSNYCHVTNGIIDEVPKTLPRSWRNVSGLDKATTAHRKALGWLPVIYVNEIYDPVTQVRAGPVGCNIGDAVLVEADDVTGTYTVRAKTQTELDDEQEIRRVDADNFYNLPAVSALIDAIEDHVPQAQGKLRAAARAKIS